MNIIRNNIIIILALFMSICLHIMILQYKQTEEILENDMVYFELVKQTANTDTASVNNEITEDTNKQEKKEEIIKNNEDIPKKIIQKKKDEKKTSKKQDVIKSKGVNKTNNQAEMYIKQNYTNIHQKIVSNIIYPPRAKKLGIEGSGYLIVTINQNGSIIAVEAFDFPNKILSDAAIKAAKKASKTASHQLSTNINVKIPIIFNLD